MTDAKTKAVAVKEEPTGAELAELQAMLSSSGQDLSPVQVKLAWIYAQKRGLDIISRQLIPTIMQGKLTFITTIDGFRVIAERSGDYAGQDPIKYQTTQPDGKGTLLWAEATVYRHSWGDRGLTVRAYWDEFKPDGGKAFMWTKMPHVMLGKVAEAQALRKAFPNDMSGMYSDDEMAQAGAASQTPAPPTPQQLREQQDEAAEGVTAEDVRQADAEAEKLEVLRHNEAIVDEEEAKATGERVRYIRRRNGETDDDWQARLIAQDGLVSKSQAEWLVERGIEPTTSASRAANEGEVETVEVPPDAKVVSQALAEAEPQSADDYDALNTAYPELPEQPSDVVEDAAVRVAAATFADELPIKQGEEGTFFELEGAIVVSQNGMVTGKGNEVMVTWITDKESRIECVQAAQLAVKGLGEGEVVNARGTWTNVGERLVVLALDVKPQAA